MIVYGGITKSGKYVLIRDPWEAWRRWQGKELSILLSFGDETYYKEWVAFRERMKSEPTSGVTGYVHTYCSNRMGGYYAVGVGVADSDGYRTLTIKSLEYKKGINYLGTIAGTKILIKEMNKQSWYDIRLITGIYIYAEYINEYVCSTTKDVRDAIRPIKAYADRLLIPSRWYDSNYLRLRNEITMYVKKQMQTFRNKG